MTIDDIKALIAFNKSRTLELTLKAFLFPLLIPSSIQF